MKELFPGFKPRFNRQGSLVWRGKLQPTPESPSYQVRIEDRFGAPPLVFVLKPGIVRGALHRYSDGSLCLYWPDEFAWSSKASLAETIVPWTALWLFYYELWLVLGEWLGPESPHGREAKPASPS
jgi:hypothetical protein